MLVNIILKYSSWRRRIYECKSEPNITRTKEVEDVVITPSSGDESLAMGSAIYGFINEGNSIDDFKTPQACT